MSTLKDLAGRFVREENGAAMAEYAILLGIIAVVLVGVITPFRDAIGRQFTGATNALP